MRARLRSGEPDEGGTGVRVEMRRAFAHEIGCPENTARARRNVCGLLGKAVVCIAAVFLAGAKLIAKPPQGESGGLCNSHDVPAIRNRMAEGVEATFGVKRGAVCCGENHAGSSDRGAHCAWRGYTDSDCSGRLVSSTRNHWSAGS